MPLAKARSRVSNGRGLPAANDDPGFRVPTVVLEDMAGSDTPTVEQICVHVYDVGQALQSRIQKGINIVGLYHSGVEIFGREWSYGVNVEDRPLGITWGDPKQNTDHVYRETMVIGNTLLSPKDIVQLVEEMKSEWSQAAYDTLHRNSHHFSHALCAKLGRPGLPVWLHDLADTGGEKSGRVFLRVYDLGQTLVTQGYNMVNKRYGAFHTGVEVYGREWSFGGTPEGYEQESGVGENVPGEHPCHSFRETLMMGYTARNPEEVLDLVEAMKLEWRGGRYDMFARNCHNFSIDFCGRLGVAEIPAWVNELATSLKPESLRDQSAAALFKDSTAARNGPGGVSNFR